MLEPSPAEMLDALYRSRLEVEQEEKLKHLHHDSEEVMLIKPSDAKDVCLPL